MQKNDFLEQFRQMEILCFKTFSTSTDRSWGSMFYNPDLLERQDANHAEVFTPLNNPLTIINEIKDFYTQKNVPIRINFYDPDDNHPFKLILTNNQFNSLDTNKTTTFMILNKVIGFEELINEKDSLRVTFSNYLPMNSQIGDDIALVIHSEWVYQNIVTHENYYYFILYDDKEPVSVLSFFLHEPFMLARLDDVVTLPEKRNNGYSTFLLKFACNWVQNNDFKPYLFVTNPVVMKVYENVGFEKLFTCKRIHWVKEI